MKIEGSNIPNIGQELINSNKAAEKDPDKFHQQLEKAQAKTDSKSVEKTEESQENQQGKNEELMDAAQQFEALFLQQILDGMRDTIPESDLLDGGFAEETYEGMLDEAYAEKMAESGGIGLADMIYEQLTSERAGVSPEHQTDIKTD